MSPTDTGLKSLIFDSDIFDANNTLIPLRPIDLGKLDLNTLMNLSSSESYFPCKRNGTYQYPSNCNFRLPKLNPHKKLVSVENADGVESLQSMQYLKLLAFVYKYISIECIYEALANASRYICFIAAWISDVRNYNNFAHFCLTSQNLEAINETIERTRINLVTELLNYMNKLDEAIDEHSTRDFVSNQLLVLIMPEYCSRGVDDDPEQKVNTLEDAKSAKPVRNDTGHHLLQCFEVVSSHNTSLLINLLSNPLAKLWSPQKRTGFVDVDQLSDDKKKNLSEQVKLLKIIVSLRLVCLIHLCRSFLDSFHSNLRNPEFFPTSQHDGFMHQAPQASSYDMRIFYSISSGYLNVVQYLIKTNKVRPSACVDSDGRNLLIAAVSAGKTDIVNYLITQVNPPININAKSHSGNTALHIAVCHNNLELARLLIDSGGASVDVVNTLGNGATPLHMAAMFGYTKMAELLVQRSANIHARTTIDNLTPAQLAKQGEHHELTNWFKQINHTPPKGGTGDTNGASLLITKQLALDNLRKAAALDYADQSDLIAEFKEEKTKYLNNHNNQMISFVSNSDISD